MELKHKSFTAPSLLTKWVNNQGITIQVVSITSDSGGHNCFYRENIATVRGTHIGGTIKRFIGGKLRGVYQPDVDNTSPKPPKGGSGVN